MLNIESIKEELHTETFGNNLHIFSDINSTNTYAMQLASQGAPEGTTVIADYQSAGKGRMGRKWISDHSMNILMSFVLRPEFDMESVNIITYMTANIVISAVQLHLIENNINNLQLYMKWPNDILVNNRKIAGILTESCIRNRKIEHIVVGIGLNVNQNFTDLDNNLRNTSTSLYHETNKVFKREKIIVKIIEQYEKVYYQLASSDWVK
jgi:BirA family biotin operon repressor/biotin-[acetyl-CoA-carboxylase] ligase